MTSSLAKRTRHRNDPEPVLAGIITVKRVHFLGVAFSGNFECEAVEWTQHLNGTVGTELEWVPDTKVVLHLVIRHARFWVPAIPANILSRQGKTQTNKTTNKNKNEYKDTKAQHIAMQCNAMQCNTMGYITTRYFMT